MMKQKAVTSIQGNRYRLGQILGSGGQGEVYAVDGGRLAVKLLSDRSARAESRLRDQLAMVGRLPLEDLAIARPLEQLRPPHVGYVMDLLTGMVPLKSLMRPPKGVESVSRWYLAGGGLRRRLRLLAHAAGTLSTIHGRGITYVDPSPNNVFVSAEATALEVRLIDTDNLRPAGIAGPSFYTPGYGAPELVRGIGIPTSLSDAHAFAVMAFETLTLAHPLLGDSVVDGAPELEDEAFAGKLPWIDDEDDDRNRSSTGLPRELVLSGALREDFKAVFGRGLQTPAERPGLARWVEHLHRAADRLVTCPACSASYYFDQDFCPWCDEPRPTTVMAAVLLWDPKRLASRAAGELEAAPGIVRNARGKPNVLDALAISVGDTFVLTERLTHGTSGTAPKLRVEFKENRLTLKPLDGNRWRLASLDGRREREVSGRSIDLALTEAGASWFIHAGPSDRLHRVIRFDVRAGGAQ